VRQLLALRASTIARRGRRAPQRPDAPAARPVPRSRVGSFIVGGGLTAVGGALLLEALISAGVTRMVAFAIQLLVTLAANFLFNYLVTWRDRERSGLPSRVGWYLGTRLSTLLWSWLGFGLLTGVLSLHHQVANVICLLVAAVVNYYLSDRVVFAEPDAPTARRSLRLARWLVGVSAVAGVTTLLVVQALTLGAAVIAVFNLLVGFLDVRWRMYGWRDPDAIRQMRWPDPSPTEAAVERFSLIVPALREAAVIGTTLRRLLQSEYQDFEIIVTLCEGDDETLAEVRRVMAEDDPQGRIRVVVRAYEKSNKPRQLNAALAECTGTVVGVIDAEDDVSPGLLARVDAMFQRTGADIVQGGVQLMTLGRGPREWFKVHNVMEYYFWFTSRIFYQASRNFVPLGGNTVFIRRDLLQSVGGWPDNLTEDCALGVLLCTRYNAKVVAAYEPALATREEVPHTIANRKRGSLFWQRVRWNQGFLSVMLQGDWLTLPTLRQRVIAGYVLATPFMQALSALLLPISIAAILFVKVPVVVAMFMYLPFLPLALITAWQLVGLAEFSRAYGERAKLRHYVSLVLGAPIYAWILMAAAYWAVIRHLRRNTSWYKTVHTGDHRSPAPVLVPRLEEAR
jgi:cellulose synthase/poly-beta-1,6-N-acetylglucosamine synthase-like glycosyltransferase